MSVASEVGKIGGQKRASKLTPEQRSAIASLGGKARMLKKINSEDYAKVEAAKPVTADLATRTWYHVPLVRGDVAEYIRRAWTRRIPRAYEELLDASMREGQIDAALRVLVTMTAMTSLAPQARQAVAQITQGVNKLRQETDLSSIDTETLRRVLGKDVTPAEPPPTSGGAEPDDGREA